MAQPKTKRLIKVRQHVRQYYIRWAIFLGLSLVIGLQLIYPLDRALPGARLGGTHVGAWSFDDVATKMNQDFLEAKITLRLNSERSVTYPLRDAGAQPNTEFVKQQLVEYPLWQRLIPFSIIVRRPQASEASVFFATDQLKQFIEARAGELNTPPKNAGLKIENGQLVATTDIAGSQVNEAELFNRMVQTLYQAETTIPVPRQMVPADKPASYFRQVRTEALEALNQTITLEVDDKATQPTRSDMAGWLEITESKEGEAMLGVAEPALKKYLKTLQADTRTPAGKTHITFVNGQETERKVGSSGREIDTEKLQKSLHEAVLDSGDDHLIAVFKTIEPQAVINNTYTSSEAGLRAFVSDEVNTKNVRIAVEQLTGEHWSAYGRANESTVSASTYKLFVALRLFDDMEHGKSSWSDGMLDTDVRGCFERMIVISTNTCAETWIGQYSRSGLNNYLWSKGFSHGTDFNNPLATHTTAADLVSYLKQLQQGTLLSKDHRQYLIDALGRHGYTTGIPSGSEGRAHNKVGFLWDYSNDAAIVYHPKGTYVVAVMTKGLSFYAIADIIREMEIIMYP